MYIFFSQMDKEIFQQKTRYAITFGEVSIVHLGSTEIGSMAQNGFTVPELRLIQQRLASFNPSIKSNLINLSEVLPEELRKENQAAVLHIPGLAQHMIGEDNGADLLYEQQEQIDYDKKYFDSKKQKTFNKRARYNIVFGEQNRAPNQDYQQYSIKSFDDLKYLNLVRKRIGEWFEVNPELNKQYLSHLNAQGNKYYNEQSGIGFHGDGERKIVICLSLGKSSILRYCWRKPHSSQNNDFDPIDLQVKHGDLYIMSEKATGNDWRKRSQFRLVHAAGSHKYIKVRNKE